MMNTKKIFKWTGIIFGLILLFLIASNFIWLNERENLLYKMQQYVTYSKEDWKNYETNEKYLENTPTEVAQTSVASAAVTDFHPYNIGFFTGNEKTEELKRIKDAHFEKLIPAKNKPSDEDVQAALIRLTQGRLTDVIINQKLNIKVGQCYENPNTEGNYNCVSCMILLYNRDKKDWQEAPDGDNFLDNSYDFYQPSEGDIWEAKNLSIMIPYDYELIKKYEKK
ncbi:hypothetical protein [Chryseobacterium sp. ERMR1:04]|uniref:hypothetical protein n=1 Tax=Chryseobacterium sp. ERMR1:04 TaxID=1705393 RepID=UPI0006C8C5FB|nr:hypothetical protein [Chryseobacterium sp. ERMR1:04]KPH12453.1 hypothetical protein AMQ68_16210 [Chryseobacterium sp. ERMR1:04]